MLSIFFQYVVLTMLIKATKQTVQQCLTYIHSQQADHLLLVAYLYARHCVNTQEFAEIRGPGAWLTCGTTYPKVALLRDRASFQSQVLVPQTFHAWTKVLVVRTDATLVQNFSSLNLTCVCSFYCQSSLTKTCLQCPRRTHLFLSINLLYIWAI